MRLMTPVEKLVLSNISGVCLQARSLTPDGQLPGFLIPMDAPVEKLEDISFHLNCTHNIFYTFLYILLYLYLKALDNYLACYAILD